MKQNIYVLTIAATTSFESALSWESNVYTVYNEDGSFKKKQMFIISIPLVIKNDPYFNDILGIAPYDITSAVQQSTEIYIRGIRFKRIRNTYESSAVKDYEWYIDYTNTTLYARIPDYIYAFAYPNTLYRYSSAYRYSSGAFEDDTAEVYDKSTDTFEPCSPRLEVQMISKESEDEEYGVPLLSDMTVSILNPDNNERHLFDSLLIHRKATLSVLSFYTKQDYQQTKQQYIITKGDITEVVYTTQKTTLTIRDERNFEETDVLRTASHRKLYGIATTLMPLNFGRNTVPGIATETNDNTFLFADDRIGTEPVTHTINEVFYYDKNTIRQTIPPLFYEDKNGIITLRNTSEARTVLFTRAQVRIKFDRDIRGYHYLRGWTTDDYSYLMEYQIGNFSTHPHHFKYEEEGKIITITARFSTRIPYKLFLKYSISRSPDQWDQLYATQFSVIREYEFGVKRDYPFDVKEALFIKRGKEYPLPKSDIVENKILLTRYYETYLQGDDPEVDDDGNWIGPIHPGERIKIVYDMPSEIYVDVTTDVPSVPKNEIAQTLITEFSAIEWNEKTIDIAEINDQSWERATMYITEGSLADILYELVTKSFFTIITKPNGKISFRNYTFKGTKQSMDVDNDIEIKTSNATYASTVYIQSHKDYSTDRYTKTTASSKARDIALDHFMYPRTKTLPTLLSEQNELTHVADYFAQKYARRNMVVTFFTPDDIHTIAISDILEVALTIQDFDFKKTIQGKVIGINYTERTLTIREEY